MLSPGPPLGATLPGASIVKVSVGPMDNNAYLVTCSQTGETLLIDAANDAEILLELIERYAPKLSLIVTSHQHQDHWLALPRWPRPPGAPTAAHQLDADPLPVKPDRILANGDTVKVGELSFDVIHLQRPHPGIGGVGAERGRPGNGATHLFTGDCLFPGGVGKTWKEGDFEKLLGDVTAGYSTSTGTRRSFIPVTATTPRSGPSAHTWPSGKSAVGDLHRGHGRCRHGRQPWGGPRNRACARQPRVHRLCHGTHRRNPASRRSQARSQRPPNW